MSSQQPERGASQPQTPRSAADAERFADWRNELKAAGYRPSRRLGQNLLMDDNLCRAIALDAQLEPGDLAVEVGPGAGALTRHLCSLGLQILAVEIDARLLEFVQRRIAAEFPDSHASQVRWFLGDALAGKHLLNSGWVEQLPASSAEAADPGAETVVQAADWHMVSNLPYSISAPLLVLAARLPNPPKSMTVLVQREVADRMASEAGGSSHGPLSVRLQANYSVQLLRVVGREVFWPRPQVESQVVRLKHRSVQSGAQESEAAGSGLSEAALAAIDECVDWLLGRRRQSLGRLMGERLGRELTDEWLADLGLTRDQRAEVLNREQWLAIAARWRSFQKDH